METPPPDKPPEDLPTQKKKKEKENEKERKFSDVSDKSFDEGEGEDLDPRVKNELEELNAATDGINHLETELVEAKTIFNRSIEDAKVQLIQLHKTLGKCVDRARPYYEALRDAKNARQDLQEVSSRFEGAQARYVSAKKAVTTAEKRVDQSVDGKLSQELQELLNNVTTELMDTAQASSDAEERYLDVNTDFNQRHAHLQQTYNKLKNDVAKSRSFFELKSNMNKKLEVQKQRVDKIEEGIQLSKDAYQQRLVNLQLISEDIHNSRQKGKPDTTTTVGDGDDDEVDGQQPQVGVSHDGTSLCSDFDVLASDSCSIASRDEFNLLNSAIGDSSAAFENYTVDKTEHLSTDKEDNVTSSEKAELTSNAKENELNIEDIKLDDCKKDQQESFPQTSKNSYTLPQTEANYVAEDCSRDDGS